MVYELPPLPLHSLELKKAFSVGQTPYKNTTNIYETILFDICTEIRFANQKKGSSEAARLAHMGADISLSIADYLL